MLSSLDSFFREKKWQGRLIFILLQSLKLTPLNPNYVGKWKYMCMRMHTNVFKIGWSWNKTKDRDVTQDRIAKVKKWLRSLDWQRYFLDKEALIFNFT